MLYSWVCCGGKTKDTSNDRYKIVKGLTALIIANVLTLLCMVVIPLALQGHIRAGDLIG